MKASTSSKGHDESNINVNSAEIGRISSDCSLLLVCFVLLSEDRTVGDGMYSNSTPKESSPC